MELKEFMTRALVQLIEGVRDAQSKAKDLDGRVNPRIPENLVKEKPLDSRILVLGGTHNSQVFFVEFDIAVTVAEGEGVKGGAGISIAAVRFGADAQATSSNIQENRIKFVIPIDFPIMNPQ